METQKNVSDVEIIRDAINTINNIQLPVSLAQSVGLQLWRVSTNLKALNDAIEANYKKQHEEPNFEIVSAEEAPKVSMEEPVEVSIE